MNNPLGTYQEENGSIDNIIIYFLIICLISIVLLLGFVIIKNRNNICKSVGEIKKQRVLNKDIKINYTGGSNMKYKTEKWRCKKCGSVMIIERDVSLEKKPICPVCKKQMRKEIIKGGSK